MTSGFNFWDGEIWSFIVTLALLFGGMLLANLLRRKIRFLRKSLLPSAVLGGFLVLIFDAIYKRIFGQSMFDLSTLEALTYHGLGLGFIALAWRHLDGVKGKKARKDVFNTSTVTVGGYLLQAVAGLLITLCLSYIIGAFAAGGILLPMGYGQGPGQAFNWGTNYQSLYGFTHGSSFGLTIAAMGFVSACVGGVYYLNKMRRAGDARAMTENAEAVEELSAERITGGNEIPVSESMDKLTVQFGLVFLTYLVAYASMWLLYHFVLEPAGGFCMNTINPLIASRFPEVFARAFTELQQASSKIPAWLNSPEILMIITSAIGGVIIWSILHSVFIRPFVLTGVLRNYIQSGMDDIPDEKAFSVLDGKSAKFKKLHQEAA